MTATQLLLLVLAMGVIRVVLQFLTPKPAEGQPGGGKGLQFVKESLEAVIVAGLVAVVITTFVVQFFYIPSESMVPTLKVKDLVLVNKFIYRFHPPHRGDIVVFDPPAAAHEDGKEFIKRIVALGGDRVKVQGGILYVNGVPQDEPYTAERSNRDFPLPNIDGTWTFYDGRTVIPKDQLAQAKETDWPEYIVPPNAAFMMGDNRNNSSDSRVWGPEPLAHIVGHAMLIFWPPVHMRIFR